MVRFGNSCKDPQWHNLDRYFEKYLKLTLVQFSALLLPLQKWIFTLSVVHPITFRLESELTPHKQLKEEAETVMLHLMTLVQYTAVSSTSASTLLDLFFPYLFHFFSKVMLLNPNLSEMFDWARSFRGKGIHLKLVF